MDGVRSNEQKATSCEEEIDLSEQNEEEVAPTQARTYDCIYCKRGFTTAQALGGHMNIHRKDRGKTSRRNPEPPAIEKTEDYSGRSYGYYPSYPNFQAYQPPSYTEYPSYSMYMPPSSSDVQSTRSDVGAGYSSQYGNDLQLGLGFHADTSQLEDEEEKEIDMDDGPDLELRLGYTAHRDD